MDIGEYWQTVVVIMITEFCAGVFLLYLIARYLRDLAVSINGRLTELVRTSKLLARSEGFEAGKKNHLDAIKRAAGEATEQQP